MSLIDNYRSRTTRIRTEIATLTEKKAREQKKIAGLSSKIQASSRTLHSTRSISTMQSKQKEILRYQQDIVKGEKIISDLETKIAKKNKDLDSELKKLNAEEIKECKKTTSGTRGFPKEAGATISVYE